MNFVRGLLLGILLTSIWFYWMDNYTWTRALASFVCGLDGRVNVFVDTSESYCVDMSDAYRSEEVLERYIKRTEKN